MAGKKEVRGYGVQGSWVVGRWGMGDGGWVGYSKQAGEQASNALVEVGLGVRCVDAGEFVCLVVNEPVWAELVGGGHE